jgi:antitoxin (DNA-binding transcriptional repressor) of toxin-antitoxin stability system
VIITKNGRPVAKLVPVDPIAKDSLGSLVGIIEIVGDIESPPRPAEDWEALR